MKESESSEHGKMKVEKGCCGKEKLMITLLNRKEIATTTSKDRQAEIRHILGACGVDYRWKIIQANHEISENSIIQGKHEYIIYVARKDYDKAMMLLHTYKRQ